MPANNQSNQLLQLVYKFTDANEPENSPFVTCIFRISIHLLLADNTSVDKWILIVNLTLSPTAKKCLKVSPNVKKKNALLELLLMKVIVKSQGLWPYMIAPKIIAKNNSFCGLTFHLNTRGFLIKIQSFPRSPL